jgi:CRP-like cAMP-binding protein
VFESSFLQALPREEADRLVADGRRRRFARGEVVFHEEDPGETLHLITLGHFGAHVGTDQGDQIMLQVMGPGDVFGELSLFRHSRRRTASITALEKGETVVLYADKVLDACERHPAVTEYFLELLGERSQHNTNQLLEILFVPAEVRVVRRVLELAESYGQEGIGLTQEQIGRMAWTSRPTVNKALRQAEDAGAISLSRGRIHILDDTWLRRRAARGSVPFSASPT